MEYSGVLVLVVDRAETPPKHSRVGVDCSYRIGAVLVQDLELASSFLRALLDDDAVGTCATREGKQGQTMMSGYVAGRRTIAKLMELSFPPFSGCVRLEDRKLY